MSTIPAISVVLRTKNESRTLAQVLQGIRQQTVASEILIVDSGSTDGTLAIAERFGAHIIRIAPESFRYGYALNRGIEHARGEIIVSLSGHSIPLDEMLFENMLREFRDPSVAGVSFRQIAFPQHLPPVLRLMRQSLYQHVRWRNQLVVRVLFENSGAAIRASLWKHLPFDDDIVACEDHVWARQVNQMGYRLAYCHDARIMHSHDLSPQAGLKRNWCELQALSQLYLTDKYTVKQQPLPAIEESQQ